MSHLRITKEYSGCVATINKGMLDCSLIDIAVKRTSRWWQTAEAVLRCIFAIPLKSPLNQNYELEILET
jgi:hypothetical protein